MIELRPADEILTEAIDRLTEEPDPVCVCPKGTIEHALFVAELYRGRYQETPRSEPFVPISRKGLRSGKPTTEIDPGGSLRTIGTSRRCAHPVGLVLADQKGLELTPVPCRKCAECRRWEQTIDQARAAEAITAPVLTYVPEDRWEATRKRLQRADLPYLAVPTKDGRRAVITEAAYSGPVVGPVDDLAETLAKLDRKRDRKDRRRVSSSGLRSRNQIEAEVYERPTAEERQVVGFWNPRLVSASRRIEKVSDDLEAAALVVKVPHERRAGSVLVTVGRHDPRAELLWQRLGVLWLAHAVPWYEGGPPPEPGERAWASFEAAQPKPRVPLDDSVPFEVYQAELAAYEERWAS